MASLDQKLKFSKTRPKTILKAHYSSCMQTTAPKSAKCSKNDKFSKIGKIGHYAKAIDFPKWSVWVKIENCQKLAKKTILKAHYSHCMQKTAPKTTKRSKDHKLYKIGKIGRPAKSIDFPKWSVWVKNENCQKLEKNNSKSTL